MYLLRRRSGVVRGLGRRRLRFVQCCLELTRPLLDGLLVALSKGDLFLAQFEDVPLRLCFLGRFRRDVRGRLEFGIRGGHVSPEQSEKRAPCWLQRSETGR